jgi:hypothetical protein
MARIRTIKPDFWLNESIASISSEAALLAIGLLNYADDEGYFNANPLLIKAAVFPIRDTSCIATVLLRELSNIGYIELFNDTSGRLFGRVSNFKEHQVINKPTPSKISELELLPYNYGSTTVALPSGKERKGKESNGREARPKKISPLSLKTKSTIQSWEASFGKLSIEHLGVWVEENNLSTDGVKKELEIFRNKCEAKGYEYVNFPAAFKDWGCDKEKCKKKVSVDEFNRLQREKWEV